MVTSLRIIRTSPVARFLAASPAWSIGQNRGAGQPRKPASSSDCRTVRHSWKSDSARSTRFYAGMSALGFGVGGPLAWADAIGIAWDLPYPL